MKIFPKAYIKTEIIKYINKIEQEEGKLEIQDIFELLPEIYQMLVENLIGRHDDINGV